MEPQLSDPFMTIWSGSVFATHLIGNISCRHGHPLLLPSAISNVPFAKLSMLNFHVPHNEIDHVIKDCSTSNHPYMMGSALCKIFTTETPLVPWLLKSNFKNLMTSIIT